MDWIFWRHAQAHELSAEYANDRERALTPRGHQQAQWMSAWLQQHLPAPSKILCSPARRCLQTVQALERRYDIVEELGPEYSARDILAQGQHVTPGSAVLIIGHQPSLGQAAIELLGLQSAELSIRKGSVWWVKTRLKNNVPHSFVHCVQPALLEKA